MVFEESRSIRSFVGRIDPGDDIIEALTLLCDANDVNAAEVRVSGTISDVEVVEFDPDTKEYVTIVEDSGPFDVVQFSGNMAKLGDQPAFRAEALLATRGPAGQQLVFGQLRAANAVDCEFVVHSFSDLKMSRKLDPATGRFPVESIERTANAEQPASEPVKRERQAPETVSKPAGTAGNSDEQPAEPGDAKSDISWADAAAASESMKPASERANRGPGKSGGEEKEAGDIYGDVDFEEAILEAGDLLDHPKLGECRVIKVEDDDYAHIRLSRGQIRKLALTVVQLEYTGERDGRKVFKVRIGK